MLIMEQQQEEQLSHKTQKTLPFSGDLEMIKNQNPISDTPEFKNNDSENCDIVLGLEDGKKAVFEKDLAEKSNFGEKNGNDRCEIKVEDYQKAVFERILAEKFNLEVKNGNDACEIGSEDGEKAVFENELCEKSNLGEFGVQRDGDEFDGFDDEEVERRINEELKELVLNQAIGEQTGSFDGEEGFEKMEDHGWGEYEEEEFGEVGKFGNGNEDDNWGKEEEGQHNAKKMVYPLRPDAEDCSFYMKTGSCKYGFHCKFNHPPVPRRKYQPPKDKIKPREEHLERSGQTECKYYLSSIGCKYGRACKFNHSREKSTGSPATEFNFLGLPIRPGENECPYYMRNGSCKYGSTCRFHHPEPTSGLGGDPSAYGNGAPLPGASQSTSWSSPRALGNAASFVPMMYPPAQGIHASTDWNGYQAPVYQTSERSRPTPPAFTLNSLPTPPAFTLNSLPTPPALTMNNLGTEASFPSRHHQPLFMDEFPERPGQPECSYFLKTGDCKYKSNCRFHHPKNRVMKSSSWTLSDKGLPLRPEHPVCSFYQRYGICKFGPACKFDHPENMGNSVHSSLSDFEQSSFGNAVA